MTADARDELAETPLFERLDDAALEALLVSASEVEYAAGVVIVREDEIGDALYVIVDGAIQIFKKRSDGSELVIARLEAGDYFGEQALLPGPVRRRNASARACEPVRLCRIEKAAFQAVLATNHPLKEHLLDVGDDQVLDNLALESRLFRALGKVAHEGTERAVAAGEVIFREGDPPDALYLVVDGAIEIYRDANERGVREVLATLPPGTSFGELGILENTDRAASARALEDSRVLAIPASRFQAWQSPELRELFGALRRVYRLPNRGTIVQSAGTFLGRDAITNVYELDGGRTVVVSLVVGDELYNCDEVLDVPRPTTEMTYVDPARQIRRQLRVFTDGRLAGMTVHGMWPALAELQRRLLDHVAIAPAVLATFEHTGELVLDGSANTLVCSCMRVDAKTLVAAIGAGANRLAALQAKTGCGTVCGACLPSVRHMLGNEQWAAVQLSDERRHPARDVIALRLRPVDRPVAPAHPGQHVIVSGYIDGEWLQRAYTLSSACSEREHYEITVKREPGGRFSSWLFDHAGLDTMLRVSAPRGEVWWRPSERPVVFIAAGIGITPALAAVRSAVREGWTAPVHVDASAHTVADLAGRDELAAIATAHPDITFALRATAEQGRIKQADIDTIATRYPDADYFVCGPESFMTGVAAMLAHARVAPGKIKVERFTAAAAPAPAPPRAVARAVAPRPQPAPAPSLRGLFKSLFQRA